MTSADIFSHFFSKEKYFPYSIFSPEIGRSSWANILPDEIVL